ncbi:MAG: hypothetical protein KY451_07915 [Actinobacteria bacterium]|nr:hypothetical protein [Actinomycetota bacterium]MBW3648336.1 hypothetical protein [Actinomycetota bacterium]
MAQDDDVAAAREAARALEQAVSDVIGHYPDSVDARRLRVDTARVTEDLDLLCGEPAEPTELSPAPGPPARMIIADTPYAHDFWMDAEDEGLGGAGYR